jgi:hypothetical protein
LSSLAARSNPSAACRSTRLPRAAAGHPQRVPGRSPQAAAFAVVLAARGITVTLAEGEALTAAATTDAVGQAALDNGIIRSCGLFAC